MEDEFILNEDIFKMIKRCMRNSSVLKYANIKTYLISRVISLILDSNKTTVGIPVESLYQTTMLKCREVYQRLDLTRAQFSFSLAFIILNNSTYRLKKFRTGGWIVLDQYGRTLENSYSSKEFTK